MKKRAKKQLVTATATATIVKLGETSQPEPEPEKPEEPAAEGEAPVPEPPEAEPEVSTPEATEETPPTEEPASKPEVEEQESEKEEAPLAESFCAPGGKLCTCARSTDSLPRVPTAILVERHGERLRKHEEKLKDLEVANATILQKLVDLKDQLSVAYGLSLVIAIVFAILTIYKP